MIPREPRHGGQQQDEAQHRQTHKLLGAGDVVVDPVHHDLRVGLGTRNPKENRNHSFGSTPV